MSDIWIDIGEQFRADVDNLVEELLSECVSFAEDNNYEVDEVIKRVKERLNCQK